MASTFAAYSRTAASSIGTAKCPSSNAVTSPIVPGKRLPMVFSLASCFFLRSATSASFSSGFCALTSGAVVKESLTVEGVAAEGCVPSTDNLLSVLSWIDRLSGLAPPEVGAAESTAAGDWGAGFAFGNAACSVSSSPCCSMLSSPCCSSCSSRATAAVGSLCASLAALRAPSTFVRRGAGSSCIGSVGRLAAIAAGFCAGCAVGSSSLVRLSP